MPSKPLFHRTIPKPPATCKHNRTTCASNAEQIGQAAVPPLQPRLAPGPAPKPIVTNILDIDFLAPGSNIEHLYREYSSDVLRFNIFGITGCYFRNPEHFEQAMITMPYATFDKTSFEPVEEWLGVWAGCVVIHVLMY